MGTFSEYGQGRLVGIAGTLGSGKDTAANYLADQHGFLHISTSDVLREECRARGLKALRPTLIEIGKQMRAAHGPAALIMKGVEAWAAQRDQYPSGLVATGLRAVSESQAVLDMDGDLLFIDAPDERRYLATQARDRTDAIYPTLAAFQAHEYHELHGGFGDDGPNLLGVKALATFTIWNEMIDRAGFLQQVATTLELPG